MNKKITKEIRDILEGIRDGRLKYTQELYHCGTAHCVAGWKLVLDMCKEDKTLDIESIGRYETNEFLKENTGYGEDTGDYATRHWKLSRAESETLFDEDARLEDQFALLESLESGVRHT